MRTESHLVSASCYGYHQIRLRFFNSSKHINVTFSIVSSSCSYSIIIILFVLYAGYFVVVPFFCHALHCRTTNTNICLITNKIFKVLPSKWITICCYALSPSLLYLFHSHFCLFLFYTRIRSLANPHRRAHNILQQSSTLMKIYLKLIKAYVA